MTTHRREPSVARATASATATVTTMELQKNRRRVTVATTTTASRTRSSVLVVAVVLSLLSSWVVSTRAFIVTGTTTTGVVRSVEANALFARTAPGSSRPPPRRRLKKRPGRRNRSGSGSSGSPPSGSLARTTTTTEIETETRPIIKSKSIEAGTDYWIDEEELVKSLQREKAIKNRKAMETEIPQEKLRTELVAPYKQNWIGFLSVLVVVLSVIFKNFPELLEMPSIPFPDL